MTTTSGQLAWGIGIEFQVPETVFQESVFLKLRFLKIRLLPIYSHLGLLYICFSSKKQQQMCKTGTIASKNTFLIKSSFFLLVPQSLLPRRSWSLGPLGDLQGTPRDIECWLGIYMVSNPYVTSFKATQTDCQITSKTLTLVHSNIILLGRFYYSPMVYEICVIDYTINYRFIN